jgi:hypothetical protein
MANVRGAGGRFTGAGTSAVQVTVLIHGNVLRGLSEPFIRAACQVGQQAVAEEGVNRVHSQLQDVLQHPTGYYESQVVTDRSTEESRVTDGGVVYGPWLEGTGSRNQSTRFKGYRTFRIVTQGLKADAGGIARGAMMPILERLNG